MGRAPCCDKANVKKGPWSPEEDAKLKDYIEKNGTGGNWIALPQKIGLKRCGKSCRLRWLNYLRPNLKHGGFSEEEDNMICNLYISIGSRWSIIAAQLPGRTDNDIKNYWNTKLKKKLLGKQRKEHHARRSNLLKQDMKKEIGIPAISDHVMQAAYWPEPLMPISTPYANQDSRLNDHASLRKLLIKLGGKFSDDHQTSNEDSISNTKNNYPPQLDIASTYPSNLLSTTSLNNPYSKFFNEYEGASMEMIQGLESVPGMLDEQMICNTAEGLNGLECYYGVGMNHGSSSCPIAAETTSWNDMECVVDPPNLTNYECEFNESRYLGFP